MKLSFLFVLCLSLFGCATSRDIVIIPHADGSGYTRYKYIAAGGIIRPGVIMVVAETIGSNAPVVMTQASGSPILPSAVQMSGFIGAAATLGATHKPDETHNSSTTVIQEGQRSTTPGPPGPAGPSGVPLRPPFGPPPWQGQHPSNRGH